LGLLSFEGWGDFAQNGSALLRVLRWALGSTVVMFAPGLPLALLTIREERAGIAHLAARAMLLSIVLGVLACTLFKLAGLTIDTRTAPFALGIPALVCAVPVFARPKRIAFTNDFGPTWRTVAVCTFALVAGLLALHDHILPAEDQYLAEYDYDRIRQWDFGTHDAEITPSRFVLRQARTERTIANAEGKPVTFGLKLLLRNRTAAALLLRVRLDGALLAEGEIPPRYDRFEHSRNFALNTKFVSAAFDESPGPHKLTIDLADRSGAAPDEIEVIVDDLGNTSRRAFWRAIRRRHVIGDIGDMREPVNFARSLQTFLIPFAHHHDLSEHHPPAYSLADPPLHHHLAMLALSAMGDDIRSITAFYWFEVLLVFLLTVWLAAARPNVGARSNAGALACVPVTWVLTTFIRPGLESNTPHLTFCVIFLLAVALLRVGGSGYFMLAAALAMMTKPHGLPMALFAVVSLGVFFGKRRKEAALLGAACLAVQLALVGAVFLIDRVWGPMAHKDVLGFRAGTLGRLLLCGQWRWGLYLLRNAAHFAVLLLAASCFAPLFCWRGSDRWGRALLLIAGLAFAMVSTMNYVRCHYVGTVCSLLAAAAIRSIVSDGRAVRRWLGFYFLCGTVAVVWCFMTGPDHTSPWAGPLARSRVSPFCRAASLERRADDALARGDRQRAIRLFRQAVSFGSPRNVTWCRLVQVLIEDGKPGAAYQTADEAVIGSAEPAKLLRRIGMELYAKRRFAHALTFLDRSLEHDPDSVAVLYEAGNTLAKLGRFGAAERRFRQVVERKPDHVKALTNLGVVLVAGHKAHDALVPLRRAVTIDPKALVARFNIALALEELNDIDSATAELLAFIDLCKPDDPRRAVAEKALRRLR